jgi:hypothetical protein
MRKQKVKQIQNVKSGSCRNGCLQPAEKAEFARKRAEFTIGGKARAAPDGACGETQPLKKLFCNSGVFLSLTSEKYPKNGGK